MERGGTRPEANREYGAVPGLKMYWTAAAAILLALGVMLGAFGAHALRARLDAYLMSVYERAVFYHFVHSLGLLIVSLLPRMGVISEGAGAWICGLLLTGVV